MEKRKSAKRRRKKEKKEPGGMFYLFHPGDLQRQIDGFGYSFSMGKYILFLLAAVAGR